MSYVITGGCCNDASCVAVCPVDCIRPHPEDPAFRTTEQLYIDPGTCIDCSACMFACPVSVIHDGFELPDHLSEFRDLNAEYFAQTPLDRRFVDTEPAATPAPAKARIAVVGSGPAACYAIAELCRVPGIEISVFERLPTPFGLVRSGVAPDHPRTKQISETFQSTLDLESVTCYFNVEVGTDVDLDELKRSHHAVIYAAGAHSDRSLDIGGEALPGSCSAREFVSWYNGHPDFTDHQHDFSADTAVIIGNGNVALDVARSLVSPIEVLETTDMADHAVAALRGSAVDTVVIAARRGPADAACTSAELLELCQLPGVEVGVVPDEIAEIAELEGPLNSAQQRKLEIFSRLPDGRRSGTAPMKRIIFRFGMTPQDIVGIGKVDSITFRQPAGRRTETIRCGLVIRAVGYRVIEFPGLPFDQSTRTIANQAGRVVDEKEGRVHPGLFCVGWAKRGATGVIGTNKVCSQETVAALLEDLKSGNLPEPTLDTDDLDGLIRSRQPNVVDRDGWNTIDAEERRRGGDGGASRVRRKIVNVEEMLRLIDSSAAAAVLTTRSQTESADQQVTDR